MKIRALQAIAIVEDGKITSIAHGAVSEVSDEIAQSLINDKLAEEYTLVSPTGTVSITENGTVDVTEYATANVNVIDQNLVRLIGSRNTDPQYTITIPPGVQTISYFAFYQATTMVGVNIPDSVTLIDSCAFQSSGLRSIEIPDSVTTFGSGVFRNCSSLTSVEIPASVTNMGAETFYDCTYLTSVTMKATTPPDLGLDAFYNTHADLVIYVPAASVDTYKAASGWSTYASIIQAIS